ncbi:MAG: hypothetical protein LUG49_05045 [Oscillospiraceae bacterium]|nr:hypothetical protein [Oscillospiraceae bacterium]
MATSSIFYNFTITDPKAAERFADALEKASQQPPWKPQTEVGHLVTDPEELRAMFEKRKKLDAEKRSCKPDGLN